MHFLFSNYHSESYLFFSAFFTSSNLLIFMVVVLTKSSFFISSDLITLYDKVDVKTHYLKDKIHLNDAGNEILGNLLIENIKV